MEWKSTSKLAASAGQSTNFSAPEECSENHNNQAEEINSVSDPDSDYDGPGQKKSRSSLRRHRKSGSSMLTPMRSPPKSESETPEKMMIGGIIDSIAAADTGYGEVPEADNLEHDEVQEPVNAGLVQKKNDDSHSEDSTLTTSESPNKSKNVKIPTTRSTASFGRTFARFTFSQPSFSQSLDAALKSKQSIKEIWNKLIEESCAQYLEEEPQNKRDYAIIGRTVFTKYPRIKMDGQQPWTKFTQCLSKRIRRARKKKCHTG